METDIKQILNVKKQIVKLNREGIGDYLYNRITQSIIKAGLHNAQVDYAIATVYSFFDKNLIAAVFVQMKDGGNFFTHCNEIDSKFRRRDWVYWTNQSREVDKLLPYNRRIML